MGQTLEAMLYGPDSRGHALGAAEVSVPFRGGRVVTQHWSEGCPGAQLHQAGGRPLVEEGHTHTHTH